jgi:DNA-binding PadR family transcriptional regulator
VAYLGEFEQLILFAILRLADEAYGVRIRQEIEARTGREVSVGAIYTALGRLERRDLLSARVGEANTARGGRRRKYYSLLPDGARALHSSYVIVRQMSDGLVSDLESLATVAGAGEGR